MSDNKDESSHVHHERVKRYKVEFFINMESFRFRTPTKGRPTPVRVVLDDVYCDAEVRVYDPFDSLTVGEQEEIRKYLRHEIELSELSQWLAKLEHTRRMSEVWRNQLLEAGIEPIAP